MSRHASAAPPARSEGSWAASQRRGDELADRGQWVEAIGAWRQAYADAPLGTEGDPVREELLTSIARAERQLYEIDGDLAHLRRADELLERVEGSYRERTGISDAADPHLAEIRFEREAIAETLGAPTPDATASSDGGDEVEGPDAPPAPPPVDPALARKEKVAEGVVVAGAVVSGIGLGALLFGGGGFLIAAEIAEDRRERGDAFLVSDTELARRERWRRDVARTSAWIGLGVGAGGLIILGAGLGARAKVRKQIAQTQRTARVHPTILPGYAGLGVSGRF